MNIPTSIKYFALITAILFSFTTIANAAPTVGGKNVMVAETATDIHPMPLSEAIGIGHGLSTTQPEKSAGTFEDPYLSLDTETLRSNAIKAAARLTSYMATSDVIQDKDFFDTVIVFGSADMEVPRIMREFYRNNKLRIQRIIVVGGGKDAVTEAISYRNIMTAVNIEDPTDTPIPEDILIIPEEEYNPDTGSKNFDENFQYIENELKRRGELVHGLYNVVVVQNPFVVQRAAVLTQQRMPWINTIKRFTYIPEVTAKTVKETAWQMMKLEVALFDKCKDAATDQEREEFMNHMTDFEIVRAYIRLVDNKGFEAAADKFKARQETRDSFRLIPASKEESYVADEESMRKRDVLVDIVHSFIEKLNEISVYEEVVKERKTEIIGYTDEEWDWWGSKMVRISSSEPIYSEAGSYTAQKHSKVHCFSHNDWLTIRERIKTNPFHVISMIVGFHRKAFPINEFHSLRDKLLSGSSAEHLFPEERSDYDFFLQEVIGAFVEAIESGTPGVRKAAVDALKKMNEYTDERKAINFLYARNIEELVKIGNDAVPALIKALHDDQGYLRVIAAEALGDIGDRDTVPVLIKALDDSEWHVREKVVEALGKIGDKRAVPAIVRVLKDSNMEVSKASVEALGKIGDKGAVPALTELLRSSLRDMARDALKKMGAYTFSKYLLKNWRALNWVFGISAIVVSLATFYLGGVLLFFASVYIFAVLICSHNHIASSTYREATIRGIALLFENKFEAERLEHKEERKFDVGKVIELLPVGFVPTAGRIAKMVLDEIVRIAETKEDIEVLTIHYTDALLLPDGSRLLSKQILKDYSLAAHVVVHEQVESLMQIKKKNTPEAYQIVMDSFMEDRALMKIALQVTPQQTHAIYTGRDDLWFNHLVATAFDIMAALKRSAQLSDHEELFIAYVKQLIEEHREFFDEVFWNAEMREEVIAQAKEEGFFFDIATHAHHKQNSQKVERTPRDAEQAELDRLNIAIEALGSDRDGIYDKDEVERIIFVAAQKPYDLVVERAFKFLRSIREKLNKYEELSRKAYEELLTDQLRSRNTIAREYAAQEFSRIEGYTVRRKAIKLLHDGDVEALVKLSKENRRRAPNVWDTHSILGIIDPAREEIYQALYNKENEFIRITAIKAVGELKEGVRIITAEADNRAIATIQTAYIYEEGEVSEVAGNALQALDALTDKIKLEKYAKDKNREEVFKLETPAILNYFTQQLNAGIPEGDKVFAIEILCATGEEKVIGTFIRALRDPSPVVREAAVEALGWMRDYVKKDIYEIIPLLNFSVDDTSTVVVSQALREMENRGSVASYKEALRQVIKRREKEVILSAIAALGKIGNKKAAPALGELLRNRDSDIREAAAELLAVMEKSTVVEALAYGFVPTAGQIAKLVIHGIVRIATTQEDVEQLETYGADGLLLPDGSRLITEETLKNYFVAARVIVHEQVESLMQIKQKNTPEAYQAVMDAFVKDNELMSITLRVVPQKTDSIYDGRDDLWFNHLIATAFDMMAGLKRDVELSRNEQIFITRVKEFIDQHHEFFDESFWDTEKREEVIQEAKQSGFIFEICTWYRSWEAQYDWSGEEEDDDAHQTESDRDLEGEELNQLNIAIDTLSRDLDGIYVLKEVERTFAVATRMPYDVVVERAFEFLRSISEQLSKNEFESLAIFENLLVKQLRSDNARARELAEEELKRLEGDAYGEARQAIKLLHDGDVDALVAFLREHQERTLDVIFRGLRESSDIAKKVAIQAAAVLGLTDERIIRDIKRAFFEQRTLLGDVAFEALETLGCLTDRIRITQCARDKNLDEILKLSDQASFDHFEPVVDAGTEEEKLFAIEVLSALQHTFVVETFIRALKDSSLKVRTAAVEALGKRKAEAAQAVFPLVEVLSGSDDALSTATSEALGEIGDMHAALALIEATKRPEKKVVLASIAALGKIGNKEEAVPVLEEFLRHRDSDARNAAADALEVMEEFTERRQAIKHLYDGNIEELVKLRHVAVVPLLAAVQDGDWSIDTAIRALGKMRDGRAIPVFIKALMNDSSAIRKLAAEELGMIGKAHGMLPALIVEIRANLIPVLHDRERAVREAAADSLRNLDGYNFYVKSFRYKHIISKVSVALMLLAFIGGVWFTGTLLVALISAGVIIALSVGHGLIVKSKIQGLTAKSKTWSNEYLLRAHAWPAAIMALFLTQGNDPSIFEKAVPFLVGIGVIMFVGVALVIIKAIAVVREARRFEREYKAYMAIKDSTDLQAVYDYILSVLDKSPTKERLLYMLRVLEGRCNDKKIIELINVSIHHDATSLAQIPRLFDTTTNKDDGDALRRVVNDDVSDYWKVNVFRAFDHLKNYFVVNKVKGLVQRKSDGEELSPEKEGQGGTTLSMHAWPALLTLGLLYEVSLQTVVVLLGVLGIVGLIVLLLKVFSETDKNDDSEVDLVDPSLESEDEREYQEYMAIRASNDLKAVYEYVFSSLNKPPTKERLLYILGVLEGRTNNWKIMDLINVCIHYDAQSVESIYPFFEFTRNRDEGDAYWRVVEEEVGHREGEEWVVDQERISEYLKVNIFEAFDYLREQFPIGIKMDGENTKIFRESIQAAFRAACFSDEHVIRSGFKSLEEEKGQLDQDERLAGLKYEYLLEEQLRSDHRLVRSLAADALLKIGRYSIYRQAIKMLHDDNVLALLQCIKHDYKEVFNLISIALFSRNEQLQLTAIRVIREAKIADDSIIAKLRLIASESRSELRGAAFEALEEMDRVGDLKGVVPERSSERGNLLKVYAWPLLTFGLLYNMSPETAMATVGLMSVMGIILLLLKAIADADQNNNFAFATTEPSLDSSEASQDGYARHGGRFLRILRSDDEALEDNEDRLDPVKEELYRLEANISRLKSGNMSYEDVRALVLAACRVSYASVTRRAFEFLESVKEELDASTLFSLTKYEDFLAEQLSAPTVLVRTLAAEALGKIGKYDIRRKTIKLLYDGNVHALLSCLIDDYEAAMSEIRTAFFGKNEQIQLTAIRTIGLATVGDKNIAAIRTIRRAMVDDTSIIDQLHLILSGRNKELSGAAFDALEGMGEINREDELVRYFYARNLEGIVGLGDIALPKLLKEAKDGLRDDRVFAIQCLGSIRDVSAMSVLSKSLITSPDKEIRRAAVWALGQMKDKYLNVKPLLMMSLRDSNKDVREIAAYTLKERKEYGFIAWNLQFAKAVLSVYLTLSIGVILAFLIAAVINPLMLIVPGLVLLAFAGLYKLGINFFAFRNEEKSGVSHAKLYSVAWPVLALGVISISDMHPLLLWGGIIGVAAVVALASFKIFFGKKYSEKALLAMLVELDAERRKVAARIAEIEMGIIDIEKGVEPLPTGTWDKVDSPGGFELVAGGELEEAQRPPQRKIYLEGSWSELRDLEARQGEIIEEIEEIKGRFPQQKRTKLHGSLLPVLVMALFTIGGEVPLVTKIVVFSILLVTVLLLLFAYSKRVDGNPIREDFFGKHGAVDYKQIRDDILNLPYTEHSRLAEEVLRLRSAKIKKLVAEVRERAPEAAEMLMLAILAELTEEERNSKFKWIHNELRDLGITVLAKDKGIILPGDDVEQVAGSVISGHPINRILIVDDNLSPRELMEILLRKWKEGLIIDMAENVSEALMKIKAVEYDLIVTDKQMPGGTGITLATELGGRIPVILMTADSVDEDDAVVEAQAKGLIIAAFKKPVQREDMYAVLDAIDQSEDISEDGNKNHPLEKRVDSVVAGWDMKKVKKEIKRLESVLSLCEKEFDEYRQDLEEGIILSSSETEYLNRRMKDYKAIKEDVDYLKALLKKREDLASIPEDERPVNIETIPPLARLDKDHIVVSEAVKRHPIFSAGVQLHEELHIELGYSYDHITQDVIATTIEMRYLLRTSYQEDIDKRLPLGTTLQGIVDFLKSDTNPIIFYPLKRILNRFSLFGGVSLDRQIAVVREFIEMRYNATIGFSNERIAKIIKRIEQERFRIDVDKSLDTYNKATLEATVKDVANIRESEISGSRVVILDCPEEEDRAIKLDTDIVATVLENNNNELYFVLRKKTGNELVKVRVVDGQLFLAEQDPLEVTDLKEAVDMFRADKKQVAVISSNHNEMVEIDEKDALLFSTRRIKKSIFNTLPFEMLILPYAFTYTRADMQNNSKQGVNKLFIKHGKLIQVNIDFLINFGSTLGDAFNHFMKALGEAMKVSIGQRMVRAFA
ncbi:HEAT repeat domain-containing protein [Candidatus Omnitrophota bacterium]